MKPILFAAVLMLAFSLRAQAPAAVPAASEPHHHLVLENPHVRVLRVSVPAGDATLLHAHSVPYAYVSLGPADFANAVEGKPEARVKLVDGQVGYSRGGFSHLVRTDAGFPFNNVTIELLQPQGEPRNICQKIVDAPLKDCASDSSTLPADSPLRTLVAAIQQKRLFETDDVVVTSFSVALQQSYSESGAQRARLLIVGDGSELQVETPGEATKSLHGGEVLWSEAGKNLTILTPGNHQVTHFFILSFKTAAAAKP